MGAASPHVTMGIFTPWHLRKEFCLVLRMFWSLQGENKCEPEANSDSFSCIERSIARRNHLFRQTQASQLQYWSADCYHASHACLSAGLHALWNRARAGVPGDSGWHMSSKYSITPHLLHIIVNTPELRTVCLVLCFWHVVPIRCDFSLSKLSISSSSLRLFFA